MMAQIIPMVAGSEAAVEDAAGGGDGAAQDGRVHEGCRVGRPQPPPGRTRPLLGLRSCPDAQGRRMGGLITRTDDLVDGKTAGRAEKGQGAAMLAYSFRPMWRTSTYFCTCRMYVCSVH